MLSSKCTTRWRPSSFARYIAASASDSIDCSVESARLTVTPPTYTGARIDP